MSFYLKVKKVDFVPFDDSTPNDLRKNYTYYEDFEGAKNGTNLNTTFKNSYQDTRYEANTVEFGEDDVFSNFAVHSITALDNFTGGDTNNAKAEILNFNYDILSDGTILGDVIPYIIDPTMSGECRYGNVKIYFDNDNYLELTFNTSFQKATFGNVYTYSDMPYLNLTRIDFKTSSGDSLTNLFRSTNMNFIGNIGGGSTNYVYSGYFPFILSPDYRSITDVNTLIEALNNVGSDYDGTSATTPKSVFAPGYLYLSIPDSGFNNFYNNYEYTYGFLYGYTRINPDVSDTNPPMLYAGNNIRNNIIQILLKEAPEEETEKMTSYLKYNAYGCFITNTKGQTYGSKFASFFDGMTSTTDQPGGGGFGDDSGPGGGGGDFDNSSEDIDFPTLPGLSAVKTGFLSVYNPTTAQVNELSNKLWDTSFTEQIKQVWQNPMDAIIFFGITFAPMPLTVNSSVLFGNMDSGIEMPNLQSQYSILDCGSINVNEYWGNFLDYSDTQCNIYLPFIGFETLNIKDVMGATIEVKYFCDVLSGTCVANIKCKKDDLNSVIYNFSGNCNIPLPVSRLDQSQFWSGTYNMLSSAINAPINPGGLVDSISNFMISTKGSIQRSGSVGSSSGALSIKYPYLVLSRPKQQKPANYQGFYGLTSHITMKLSECNGFTKVANIHLDGIDATEQEKNMITEALYSGVFL